MTDHQIPQHEVTAFATDAVILDVREANEFAAGHVPGAVWIPLGELRSRAAEVPAVDGVLPVICRSGVRSQKAAEFLAGLGVATANVVGGTAAWLAAGRPLVSETGELPAVVAPTTQPPAAI